MENACGLDHPATWNEVREALAYSSGAAFELVSACGVDVELEVDVGNGVSMLCEELAWLRLANEALDSRLN
jgi:hypothetical protein